MILSVRQACCTVSLYLEAFVLVCLGRVPEGAAHVPHGPLDTNGKSGSGLVLPCRAGLHSSACLMDPVDQQGLQEAHNSPQVVSTAALSFFLTITSTCRTAAAAIGAPCQAQPAFCSSAADPGRPH